MMRRIVMFSAALLVIVGTVGLESARADRPAGSDQVTLRVATEVPTRGMDKVEVGGRTLYVSGKAGISAQEVVSSASFDSSKGSDVELSLTKAGMDTLAGLMEGSDAKQVVLFSGRKAVMAGTISASRDQGIATITGLGADDAHRLTEMIQRRVPGGPMYTAVADTTSIAADGTVMLDIYVSGVSDFRTGQTKLQISGGDAGELQVVNGFFDSSRPEFVFGSAQTINAFDASNNRLGVVRMEGGSDATTAKLFGTFELRASSDAAGTFTARLITTNRQSIIMTSDNKELMVSAGPPVEITVGRAGSIEAAPR